MGQAVPDQQRSVVLRSHFNALRALLAVALIAVIGLTIALVLAANDDTGASATHVVAPVTGGGPDESRIADAITGQEGSAGGGAGLDRGKARLARAFHATSNVCPAARRRSASTLPIAVAGVSTPALSGSRSPSSARQRALSPSITDVAP